MALNFETTTPDGEPVQLSDFIDQWVILEPGSMTCPVTDSNIDAMDRLQQKFNDAAVVLLDTRGGHIGEHYDVHGPS